MRFPLPLLLFLVSIIGVVAHVGAEHATPVALPDSSPNRAQRGAMKLASKLHPRMVSFLKVKADERKEFFDTEAKLKAEFKRKQKQDVQELLEKHRAARIDFSKEKSSADERASFYRGQRAEMAELKAEQKAERKEFYAELKSKFDSFHSEQNEERRELEEEIQKTK